MVHVFSKGQMITVVGYCRSRLAIRKPHSLALVLNFVASFSLQHEHILIPTFYVLEDQHLSLQDRNPKLLICSRNGVSRCPHSPKTNRRAENHKGRHSRELYFLEVFNG